LQYQEAEASLALRMGFHERDCHTTVVQPWLVIAELKGCSKACERRLWRANELAVDLCAGPHSHTHPDRAALNGASRQLARRLIRNALTLRERLQ
jgi:hypothetical protein